MEQDVTLVKAISECRACPLQETRRLTTPASVGANYRKGGLAFMAGFPRMLEDTTGVPLAEGAQRYGVPAGVLFNQALGMAGLQRDDVLVINKVRCKPPRSRIGDFPEAAVNCDQWNIAELEAYDPGVVVLLGATTLSAVFGAKAKVSQSRRVFRATSPEFVWGQRLWTASFDPAAASSEPLLLLEIADDIKLAYAMSKERGA